MASQSSGQNEYANSQNASFTDEEAAVQARTGNLDMEDFLLQKYVYVVQSVAKPYFLQGAEKEDILQEGFIGLLDAIHSFSPEKDCSFKSFARMCIMRQIISAVKSYSRQKHIPLNGSVSFQNVNCAENESNCGFELQDCITPAVDEYLISKEWLLNIHNYIDQKLSPFEKEVFKSYVEGKSYQEIADELKKT